MTASSPSLGSAWIGIQALRTPAGLVGLAVLSLTSIWGGETFQLGVSTHDLDPQAISYEVAFVGALLGCIFGLRRVEEWSWVSSRWAPGEVLWHEGLVLILPVLGLTAVPVGVALSGSWSTHPLVAVAAVLTLMRPAAVGLLLCRVPVSLTARVLALLALCWWLPAMLARSFPSSLGPLMHLALESGRSQVLATPGPWVAETSLLLALVLAARLGLGGGAPRT